MATIPVLTDFGFISRADKNSLDLIRDTYLAKDVASDTYLRKSDTAIAATSDGSGNVISTTYETITNTKEYLKTATFENNAISVKDGNDTEQLSIPVLTDAVVGTANNTVTVPLVQNVYAICDTAGDIAAKEVVVPYYDLKVGNHLTITFKNTNTASGVTLNINNTGAKPIFYRGYAIIASALQKETTIDLVFDGTNYVVIGSLFWTE